jgi:FtsH-binding integral membrane protein
MGVIGIVISSLVNLFFKSSGLDWIISVVGVFAGLTAYDTQRIKGMCDRSDDAVSMGPRPCWARCRYTSISSTCS